MNTEERKPTCNGLQPPRLRQATEDNPVFIVGAARSGTTMLQYMLRSHPELSLPTGESHFFIPFQLRAASFGDLRQTDNLRHLLQEIHVFKRNFFDEEFHGIRFDVDWLLERLQAAGCQTFADVVAGIFQLNALGEGKTRWGDKTPYYILHLETLLEMFPRARVVHIIRDGRDCALSMLQRKWDLKIFNTYHAAYLWKRYVEAGRAFGRVHPQHYFEFRYEDMLANPEQEMERLCSFLEIEFSDAVINYRKTTVPGKTPLLTQPLKKDNTAKWKNRMSPRQVRVFEAMAGDTLDACGYERARPDARLSPADWFLGESQIRLGHFWDRQIRSRLR